MQQFGAGSMIGSGIFIVTSAMARDIGSAAFARDLDCYRLNYRCSSLKLWRVSRMMPNAGGQFFTFSVHTVGLYPLYGWTVFTVIQTGVIAAIAVPLQITAIFFRF
jgi:APA family basic amino acid/polyamine antiporter